MPLRVSQRLADTVGASLGIITLVVTSAWSFSYFGSDDPLVAFLAGVLAMVTVLGWAYIAVVFIPRLRVADRDLRRE
jgi:hypothetical protein